LELSHIESKEIKLKIEEIKLVDLVNEVLRGFKNQLKKTPINVNNNLSSGLTIKADKDKLERVLVNLIDNAIKFNKEKGSINIYSEESGNNIKIVIEDSGIGIPAKDIPRIFERFYRVDKARSRELGGTGLGLSIVKHIIELHGGSVGVESTEGLGSKFCFTLPKR
jgi:two-component system phosphate regulon sensor histidine kinase PhoR